MNGLGIIGWIVLGGLAGWVASMIAGTNARQGLLGNIIAGIIGAFVGGFIVSLFGGDGVTGFNLWSFLVALLGAVVVLFIWRAITGGRKTTV
ncbi:MAG: GlsB/YeaQ/YmgE family stress response membrane protein [Candidatus Microsaccharimonas sossegonensis]|uniref:GlsB/YeaQ/YmgE family stress response membrane protein n=1 Tax=Candidatus Microsaccharimonas sossegonensis TaxID=2506948 RepID=A0A4Q0AGP2_9BACT|nr:MAG: GlsB/YeaQ/YmgE family stress response membrane protein [Candidatus Microsaccharimonas sossegonensis]